MIYGTIAPRFEVYAATPMTMPVEYAAIKAGISHLTRYFAQYYKKAGTGEYLSWRDFRSPAGEVS